MGMLGFTLTFVGAVLLINGMGGLKRIDDRSMAVFNLMVGSLFLFAALLSLVRAETAQDFHGVVAILLFAFTYLYIAVSLWFDLRYARRGVVLASLCADDYPYARTQLTQGDDFVWVRLG